MNRLRIYYGKLNLQNKLRFSYILLILIPVTFLCVVYYWVSSQSILDIAKKNILDVTVKNVQIIDRQLEAAQLGAVQLNVDEDMFAALENLEEVMDSELLVRDKKIKAVLQKYFPSDYILATNIMTPKYVFGDNSQLIIPNEAFFESGIYSRIRGKRGEVQWLPTYQVAQEFDLDYEVDQNTVFSLVQELNPVLIDPQKPNNVQYTEETQAVLVVSFEEGMLRDMFEDSNSVKGSFYCISSPEGVIVSHTEAAKGSTVDQLPWLEKIGTQRQGSLILNYQKQKVVVCFAVSEITGWVAVSVTPVNSLLDNVSKIQVLTIVVWILLFVLAMVLAAVFSRHITRPVESLVTAMRQVGKGDFSLRLPTSGTDEMQYLTEKYNEMGEKIQILIEENYKSEIRKKESEIMALNLQLNPHFLYNTLNIINMMALEEGNMEVSKMLLNLSNMLQYTFRNRQELVVFEEEYVWLQNYLHIMQVRFEGKFEVRYEVDKDIYRYKVPKLLLQPLVENAIVHGFSGMANGGILEVAGKREGDFLCLVIQDNGRGMDEEELQKAMSGDYNRIGLSNAMQRISLIYGEAGELHVKTALQKGTQITVRFPAGK